MPSKVWGEITYPFLIFNVALIPVWMGNYMPSKVWGEITYPFLIFNVATVEV